MEPALTPALSPRRGRNDFSVGCRVVATMAVGMTRKSKIMITIKREGA
jgi:hypothetical protein